MTERERKGKCIAMMFTAFGQGGDAERMAMYVEMLADIPAPVLDKACRKAITTRKYLPAIAEIIEDAQNIINEANGTPDLPFAEAWKEITKELHDTFVYGKPRFSRKEIEDTVNAFGWEELCEMKTSEIPIIRAQLKGMYEGICARAKERRTNNYVLGYGVLLEADDHGQIDTGKYPKIQRSTH